MTMAAHRWQWQDTGIQTCHTGGSGRDTRTRETGTRGTGGDVRDGDKHAWRRRRWRGRAGARGRAEGAPWRWPGLRRRLSVRVPAAPPRVRWVPMSPCPAAPALSLGGITEPHPPGVDIGGSAMGPLHPRRASGSQGFTSA